MIPFYFSAFCGYSGDIELHIVDDTVEAVLVFLSLGYLTQPNIL